MNSGPAPRGSTAAVVLAAGGSSRMGQPKQLLVYQGRTLLRRAAETTLAAGCAPVFVVLGSNAEKMRQELTGLAVRTVENVHWERGVGTSIRAGVAAAISSDPSTEEILILLCDQPHVTPAALVRLIHAKRRSGAPIACCEYAGTVGVPALFDRSLFPDLMKLPDDQGAKQIILLHAARTTRIPLPEAVTDVDAPGDYQQLEH